MGMCDLTTFCETSCENTACSQCAAASTDSCLASVRRGECATYLSNSEACTQTALNDPTKGNFCNPNTYNDEFGPWLQGVGKVYCGTGP
jgi:hypothetical protein